MRDSKKAANGRPKKLNQEVLNQLAQMGSNVSGKRFCELLNRCIDVRLIDNVAARRADGTNKIIFRVAVGVDLERFAAAIRAG